MTENSANTPVVGTIIWNDIFGSGAGDNLTLRQTMRERFNYDYDNPTPYMPLAQLRQMQELVRETLFADQSFDGAYQQMGYNSIQAHFSRPVGIANRLAAKVLGPERGAEVFVRAVQGSYPEGQHSMEQVEAGYFRFRMRGVALAPTYIKGVLLASFEITGVKKTNIQVTARTPEDLIYDCTWEI